MFNVDLKRKWHDTIRKDINNYKKRKAFDFNDKFLFKIYGSIVFLILIVCFEMFVIDELFLSLFFVPTLVVGSVGVFLNELRLLCRDNKTEKKLNKVVDVLNESNIKTNVQSFCKDNLILGDIPFTKEDFENKNLSNYCYVFFDDKSNVQCLVENNEKRYSQYSVLEEEELKELRDYYKVKRLIVERGRKNV